MARDLQTNNAFFGIERTLCSFGSLKLFSTIFPRSHRHISISNLNKRHILALTYVLFSSFFVVLYRHSPNRPFLCARTHTITFYSMFVLPCSSNTRHTTHNEQARAPTFRKFYLLSAIKAIKHIRNITDPCWSTELLTEKRGKVWDFLRIGWLFCVRESFFIVIFIGNIRAPWKSDNIRTNSHR